MRYALLVSTMLVMPGLAFATSTATPADTSSTTTTTDPATSTPSADSSITPQTNLASTATTAPADSWGSFKVGNVAYQATVVDPPGDTTNPYEVLFATGSDGKTTPYMFELTPGGTGGGTMPPVASNDLPATPAGGSGSSTGGTNTSTGGVGNNNNIIRIGGKDYQVVPVDAGSGPGTGTGSGTGSGSGTQTPKTITQLKDELVKAQRDAARLTDKLVTQINNQLPSTDPVPASSTRSTSSSGNQQVAAQ